MYIAMTKAGISISCRCRRPKYASFFSRCPDESRENCLKCKYCRAEMAAPDAMKLLNSYQTRLIESRKNE